uniref:Uncharacterized protein n=1 Tax=Anguilla anguilla TaxID=7936 RepID=A0A0E9WVX1_ANGAN
MNIAHKCAHSKNLHIFDKKYKSLHISEESQKYHYGRTHARKHSHTNTNTHTHTVHHPLL